MVLFLKKKSITIPKNSALNFPKTAKKTLRFSKRRGDGGGIHFQKNIHPRPVLILNIFRFTTARAQGIAIGGTREAVELSALSRIISEDHILSEFMTWTIIFKSLNRRSIINSSKIIFFFRKKFYVPNFV